MHHPINTSHYQMLTVLRIQDMAHSIGLITLVIVTYEYLIQVTMPLVLYIEQSHCLL